MATHSSVLAWRTPGSAEPGGLLSMGSHRMSYHVLLDMEMSSQTRLERLSSSTMTARPLFPSFCWCSKYLELGKIGSM